MSVGMGQLSLIEKLFANLRGQDFHEQFYEIQRGGGLIIAPLRKLCRLQNSFDFNLVPPQNNKGRKLLQIASR